MDLQLSGKSVLVTGGGAGIGAAISMALAQEDAVPIILSRRAPDADFMAALRQKAPHAVFIETELTRDQDIITGVALARDHAQKCGCPIYGLVNNAGVNDMVGLEAGVDAFRASLERNLVHCYTLVHLLLEDLKAAKGAVINISSKTAVTGQGATSAYVAAKAAQLGLTREWAAALAPFGIRVNAVIPAEVMTPLYARVLSTFADPQAERKKIERRIPLLGRFTLAEEIAATVVFTLSPRAGHTTGQWLFVDGGYTHLDRALEAEPQSQ